jgi:hypothetical protein
MCVHIWHRSLVELYIRLLVIYGFPSNGGAVRSESLAKVCVFDGFSKIIVFDWAIISIVSSYLGMLAYATI